MRFLFNDFSVAQNKEGAGYRTTAGTEKFFCYDIKKVHSAFALWTKVAEREGFEPPEACASPVFKTGTLNHSDISPESVEERGMYRFSAKQRKFNL